jgi:glycosyltransferase involved in cell wall biosynthesis
MKPKRILQVLNSMNRGGIETFIMNVYRNIDREHFEFDFLTQSRGVAAYDKEISMLGGTQYRLPPRRNNVFRFNRAINHFFNINREYDAVHFHISNLSTITSLKAAYKEKIKTRIIHSHGSKCPSGLHHRLLHWWNQQSVHVWGTHYFACSNQAASHLYANKLKNRKVTIVNNAIELERFVFDNRKRTAARRALDLEDQFIMGHIGTFCHAKNHAFLLDIFLEVKKTIGNAVLVLVGDGPLRPDIERRAQALNIEDSVHILGVRSDIPDLLQAMDVFILPSYNEGLPVVGIEAQAAGLKCFLSDSITRQVNVTGLVDYIPLGQSPEHWAERILACSNGYPRENMEKVMKLSGFDIAATVKQLGSVYLGETWNV